MTKLFLSRPKIPRGRLLLILIFLGAVSIRVPYPNLYMTGGDLPGHIVASMRLHLTSLFSTDPLIANFFVQVLANFSHGYTTVVVPFLLYELVFSLFHQPISEPLLVYIHSFMGILSLASVYYFVAVCFGKRLAPLTVLMLAVIPTHVGLSRAHVGQQILQLTFFYGGLALLTHYLRCPRRLWKSLYHLTLFFYVGSDNAFFIGLMFHAVYVSLMSRDSLSGKPSAALRNVYLNRYSVASLALPILAYVAVTVGTLAGGHETGYLLRLVDKLKGSGAWLDPVKVLRWMIELIGPAVFVLVIAAGVLLRKTNQSLRGPGLLLMVMILCTYFVIFSVSREIERNYVIYLAVPITVIASVVLQRCKIGLCIVVFTTLFYCLSVVYNLNIGFPTTKNYGSINHSVRNNDFGIKTLAYLIRTDKIHLSQSGIQYGLFLNYEGAWYYLGAMYHAEVERSINAGALLRYDTYVIAHVHHVESKDNTYAKTEAERRGLALIGRISRDGEVLMDLYSNRDAKSVRYFDVEEYNNLFDTQFGNLDSLPKLWLGHG